MLLTFLASDSSVSSKPQTSLLYTLLTQKRNEKKSRFIYHENWRKRNKIEERNADAKPTDNTTGNGKAKISGRFQCQDNQSWPLFSLEFGSAFSTTDKR
jgi:hypothetical protein